MVQGSRAENLDSVRYQDVKVLIGQTAFQDYTQSRELREAFSAFTELIKPLKAHPAESELKATDEALN